MFTVHKNHSAANHFDAAIQDLRLLLQRRLQAYVGQQTLAIDQELEQAYQESELQAMVNRLLPEPLTVQEWVVLILALVPHLKPDFFEGVIIEFFPGGGEFPEFGGVKGANHRGMLPTGETAQFILAGNDLQQRLEVQEVFRESGLFYRQSVLWLEPVREGEPLMSGRILLAQEWLDKLLFGKDYAPRFGLDFPARKIHTSMTWDDLVLHPRTQQQIQHISTWLQYHSRLAEDQNLKRKVKPGYRVLLYGPPGTGKTLTATLLGKQFSKEVYRIDLSQIVSKFIGETEKNLENVFRRAESRDWILFFDEADALFGKRTNLQSSHDKYANQEVSYLLQRVEDYTGLLILASNFKNNLDDAFIRRFHEVVHFPLPDAHERKVLWEKSLPASLQLSEQVNLTDIAAQYELTGASILSAVQYASLRAFSKNSCELHYADLIEGVRREFRKEEKSA